MLDSHRSGEFDHTADATTPPPKYNDNAAGGSGFGKDRRLNNAALFRRVFQRAQRSKDKFFIVLSRPNAEGYPRLGLAIAKKQCRMAHARNRLKRIVRESFRKHQDVLDGMDAIVMCTAAAPGERNDVLFKSLERHWQRVSRQQRSGPGR